MMSNRAAWVIGKDKLTEGTSINSQRLTYIHLSHHFTNAIDVSKSHLLVSLIFFIFFYFFLLLAYALLSKYN